jgi:hypothetical protein
MMAGSRFEERGEPRAKVEGRRGGVLGGERVSLSLYMDTVVEWVRLRVGVLGTAEYPVDEKGATVVILASENAKGERPLKALAGDGERASGQEDGGRGGVKVLKGLQTTTRALGESLMKEVRNEVPSSGLWAWACWGF